MIRTTTRSSTKKQQLSKEKNELLLPIVYKMIINNTLETGYLEFNNKNENHYHQYQSASGKKILINNSIFTQILPNGYTIHIEKHI